MTNPGEGVADSLENDTFFTRIHVVKYPIKSTAKCWQMKAWGPKQDEMFHIFKPITWTEDQFSEY